MMPHKINFMQHVDALTEEGRMIGSINTVFAYLDSRGSKRYIGTSTDCIGEREAFPQNIPGVLDMSRGKPALITSGGGTCRPSAYAVWKWLVYRATVEEFLNRPEKGAMLEMCYHPNPITTLYKLAEAAGWKLVDGTEAWFTRALPGGSCGSRAHLRISG